MAFRNYTAFVNPKNDTVNSIFNAITMEGTLNQFSFSGCGDLNPLQNDLGGNIIKEGKNILFNGRPGTIIGPGTRSSEIKPNLMLTGDML